MNDHTIITGPDPEPIKNGEAVPLALGVKINLLPGMPYYTVTELDTERTPPSMVLVVEKQTIGMPDRLEITGTETQTIGRDPESTFVALADSKISRQHGSFVFNNGHYYYRQSSRNPGQKIMHPGISAPTLEEKDVGTTSPQSEDLQVIIPLRKGSKFQFMKNTPIYTVTESNAQSRTLKLECEAGNDNRYTNPIHFKGSSLTVGRTYRDVIINNPLFSRDQGLIAYSAEQGFFYNSTGNALPIMLPSPQLVAEQEEICRKLEFVNPEAAGAEYKAIDALLQRITIYQKQLEDVQQLEASIVDVRRFGPKYGGKTEDSQMGYSLWLQCFAKLYAHTLTQDDQAGIEKMVSVLEKLADRRANLRGVEDGYKVEEYNVKKRDQTPFAKTLADHVQACMDELQQTGEVYMVTGFRGHHIVSKIHKANDGYHLVTYNAGAEAEQLKDGLVIAISESKIANEKQVPELMRQLVERKIRGQYSFSKDLDIDKLLVQPPLRQECRIPQKIGNCTTRSTRHMLEDALGQKLMRSFGTKLIAPEISVGEDVKLALELRKGAIQQWLAAHAPFVASELLDKPPPALQKPPIVERPGHSAFPLRTPPEISI